MAKGYVVCALCREVTQTVFSCAKCEVALSAHPCFEDYHTKRNFQILHSITDVPFDVQMQQAFACHVNNNKVLQTSDVSYTII
jgi:hypothetical protein